MERRHDGRVAVVTGAGSGIGRAIARRLAAEGANVACLDLRLDGAEKTVAMIAEADDPTATAFEVDVRDRASIDVAVQATTARHGRIDLLVNCAGIVTMSAFADLPEEEWDRVVDINLKGYFLVAQACADALAAAENPAVVNISTVEAEVVVSSSGFAQVHYNASKGGVKMLTKALALELASRGVRVNAVAPGPIDTQFTGGSITGEEAMAVMRERLLVPRVGEPEDIAAAVSFLLSEDASYITGVHLPVDGGWLVR